MAIVSTELEVQDITTLPKRTASGIDPDTDFVLGVEENGVAYKADIEDLGQSIVQGAKSNLLGRNQTVASAFSMLREETNEKIKESYGAPLVANQASDMKDKTRVYVYTGHESGYHHHGWYYWNNAAWTLGDEYNAGIVTTDVTLTLADMPADAKAVGDALDEVNTELSSIADDVEQLQEDSSGYAASTSIAPEYSPSGIYAVGDYCMHDGALYRCTTAIATAEAWNASHWTADNVKNIADGLKGDLNYSKTAPQGYILTATDEGNGTEWSPVGLPTDEQTAQAVSDWLDNHPEATTTVQDGSLTEAKFSNVLKLATVKDYVTPEMFGATGDGVTDDTLYFQQAINSGLPICLIGNYLCGELSGSNVQIVGNGHTIFNKTDGTLFNMTGDFVGDNFVIQNKEIFNYTVNDPYGTISAKNVYCERVRFNNINCCAIYLTGNCSIHLCIFDNQNFDVRSNYTGTIANRMFGIYIHQSSDTKILSISNCQFYYLIEGIYIGTYTDGHAALKVYNNLFDVIGDHAVYCNSSGDRIHAVISDNVVLRTTGSFVIGGNHHVVENNLIYGAYDGNRVLFGFSIRNGSDILLKNNIFYSGAYTTSEGIGANAIIIKSVSNAKMSVTFDGNVIDINDSNVTIPWLRIDESNQEIDEIVFKNNYISIKGCNYGILSNAIATLILNNNKIYFNQHPFLELRSTKVIMDSNYVENLENSNIFQISSYGVYKNNVFNTKAQPLRRPSDLLYDVENNTNEYPVGVYNLGLNVATTNIKHKCMKKGTLTVTNGSTRITDLDDIRTAFNNILLIFNDSGQMVNFSITNYTTGFIDIAIENGAYKYLLY